MPTVRQVDEAAVVPYGYRVGCDPCRRLRVDVPAPLLGWLILRDGDTRWSLLPQRPKRVPTDGAAQRATFLYDRSEGHRPAEVVCSVCGRRLTLNPTKLARGLDPKARGGAVLV